MIRLACVCMLGLGLLLVPTPGECDQLPTGDLQVDNEIAGWTLVRKRCHPEFCRYYFEKDGRSVGVEVTAFRDPEPSIVTQAVPGVIPVPPELLQGVERWVMEYAETGLPPIVDCREPAKPGSRDRAGLPVQSFVRFKPYARVLLAMILVGLVGLAARDWRRREHRRMDGRNIAIFVCVAVSAFVALFYMSNPAPLHGDTINDLLLARDCAAGRDCSYGVLTSWENFYQGTAWIRFISVCTSLGAGVDEIQISVIALQALSIAVVFVMVRRLASVNVALLAAAICLLLARESIEADILWNPSLFPLPVAVVHLMMLTFVRTGKTRFLVVASLFTAIVTDSHVAGTALVPALFFMGVLHGRRPLIGFLAAFSFVLPHVLLSPDSFAHNMAIIIERLGWPIFAMGWSMGVGCAYVARRWWHKRSLGLHVAVCVFVLAVPYASGAAILTAVNYPRIWRYFTPVLPAFAFVCAIAGDSLVRFLTRRNAILHWLVTGALVTAIVAASFAGLAEAHREPVPENHWTMSEVETIAGFFFDGTTLGLPDIAATLHGPGGWEFVRQVGAMAPIRGEYVSTPATETRYLFRTPTNRLPVEHPEDWTVLSLGSNSAAVYTSIASFVRQERAVTICPTGTDEDMGCYEVARADCRDPAHSGLLRYRLFLHVPGLLHIKQGSARAAELQYAIAAPEAGWRLVQTETARLDSTGRCDALIDAVDGLEFRGDLPSPSVWIFAPERGSTGSLRVRVPTNSACWPFDRLPEIYESRPEDHAWRELVGLATPALDSASTRPSQP